MTYLLIALIIIFVTSVRSLTFAFYLFKARNFIGGTMVTLLSLSAITLMMLQF